MKVDKDTKIRDLLTKHPQSIECLLKYGLSCAGCPMSQLETIEEAVAVHGIDLDEFLIEINKTIENEGKIE